MSARLGTALLAAAMVLAGAAPRAAAVPPRPLDLRVTGGAEWRSWPDFELRWTNPPTAGGAPTTVHYRVRDPLGIPITETRLSRGAESVAEVRVPPVPGAYTAEVWLEDADGNEGPAATATLHFDDRVPPPIAPPATPAWISRTAFPLTVQLGPPAGPAPLSGIRGYAVSIDPSAQTVPCTEAHCSVTEATLAATGGGGLTIGTLPDGVHYLHAVTVSGAGMRSAASAHAPLRVDLADPVTSLDGVPTGWVDRPVRLTARAVDDGSGMGLGGPGPPPFTAIRIEGEPATVAVGAGATATVFGDGTHAVAFYARDAAGNVNDGGASNGIEHRPPATAVVRIDRDAPVLAFAAAQDPRDPELIRARVSDRLSGPDPSRGWIGVRRVGSGDRFRPLPGLPPAGDQLRARWDSDAFPPGEYEFAATGFDLAGNSARSSRRANGVAMVLPNPLKATTALRAGFPAEGVAQTVPYGRSTRIGGRLSTGAGVALGGMPVRIVERFAIGAGEAARVTTARTGPGGSFALRLAPGPSREVEVGFDGDQTLGRANAAPLSLRVRSRARLRASAAVATIGGPPLVFRGRIAAAPGEIPPGGKSVQLQFRLRGLAWSEFRTVQTDRHGRFRYAYRFSDDDSRGARFQFRAYAPAQDGWPYEPGGSQPVIVRGR